MESVPGPSSRSDCFQQKQKISEAGRTSGYALPCCPFRGQEEETDNMVRIFKTEEGKLQQIQEPAGRLLDRSDRPHCHGNF